jgi:hypothetical protein
MLAIFPRMIRPSGKERRPLLVLKIARNKTIFYMDINDKFWPQRVSCPRRSRHSCTPTGGYRFARPGPKIAELMATRTDNESPRDMLTNGRPDRLAEAP